MADHDLSSMTESSRDASDYLIFGTGAIGSVFGGLLQDNGCRVTYIGRGLHFNTALEKGLKITGIWGGHYIPPAKIKEFDHSKKETKFPIILLCVKSMQTK